jgi:hypothetical protein
VDRAYAAAKGASRSCRPVSDWGYWAVGRFEPGSHAGSRELLARVDERRDSVRDDLEWANKNDDQSYRTLERSGIPDSWRGQ